jgi:hypothetical protein
MTEKLEALHSLISVTSSLTDIMNGRDVLSSDENINVFRYYLDFNINNTFEFVVVYNKRGINIEGTLSMTLSQLKVILKAHTTIDPSYQLLIGSEVMMDDEVCLCEYGVQMGSQLTLVVIDDQLRNVITPLTSDSEIRYFFLSFFLSSIHPSITPPSFLTISYPLIHTK